MARLRVWLDEPDQFDAVTAFLEQRGLIKSTRMLMALVSSSAALTPISLLAPHYRDFTIAAVVAVGTLGAGLCCVMTWFWLTRWPTQRQSLISVLLGIVCVAAWSLCQQTSALAALSCTAAAVTGGYIAFFHSTRALLFNIVVGLAASGYAAYRLAIDVDPATALAAFWLMWLINTTIPLAIRGTSTAMSRYAVQSDADPLTGLLNRRGFSYVVERRLLAGVAGKFHVVVVMVDLDDFKRVNDTRGHAEGDRVLRAVSEILRELAPADAAICRAGGEEFLLAYVSEATDLSAIATPLCEAIPARLDGLTASIGVASASRRDVQLATRTTELLVALVNAADTAMYEAKRTGGNRVVVGAR